VTDSQETPKQDAPGNAGAAENAIAQSSEAAAPAPAPEPEKPLIEKKEDNVPFEIAGVETKPLSTVEVKVTITAEDFAKRLDDIYKNIRRSVAIDGFRRGNAPLKILHTIYGKEARNECAERMRESVIRRVAEQKEWEKVNDGLLVSVVAEEGKPAEITYSFEIMPKVEIPDELLASLAAKAEHRQMTEDLVTSAIEKLRADNTTYEAKAEGEAFAKGDGAALDVFVTDSKGRNLADLSQFDEFLPHPETTLPPEVAQALEGRKVGDTLDVTVAPPAHDHEHEHEHEHAHEPLVYHVEIKSIKSPRVPNLDDDFAKDVDEKYKSLDDLKKALHSEISARIEDENRKASIRAILDAIYEKVDFEPPASLVASLTNKHLGHDEEVLKRHGLSLRQLYGNHFQSYMRNAAGQSFLFLKDFLSLQSLGKRLNVEVTDADLDAEFEREAKEAGRTPLAIRAQYEAKKRIDDLRSSLRQKKVEDYLLGRVKLEIVPPGTLAKEAEAAAKSAAAAKSDASAAPGAPASS